MTTASHLQNASSNWPDEVIQISIPSSSDGKDQPAMIFQAPAHKGPRPLLVALHTWSADYQNFKNGNIFARWAIAQDWHFIHPDFRGPNMTPEAMGSDLAVQDVIDAVHYMQKTGNVDTSRIYLIGNSGGGHMALLMAGRTPEIWAGVSAWVPIFDIAAWYDEHSLGGKLTNYAKNIESALGGPLDKEERRSEAQRRSPISCLARAKEVPIDIHHGIHDGRTGSVPFRHSLFAFNEVALPNDRLPEKDIFSYYETQQLPKGWALPESDTLYADHPVLFRKTSGNARITLFEGGHMILALPALNWLAQQQKGTSAVWEIPHPQKLDNSVMESTK